MPGGLFLSTGMGGLPWSFACLPLGLNTSISHAQAHCSSSSHVLQSQLKPFPSSRKPSWLFQPTAPSPFLESLSPALCPRSHCVCPGLSLFFGRLCHLINTLDESLKREGPEHLLLYLPDSPTLGWAQRGSEAAGWSGDMKWGIG